LLSIFSFIAHKSILKFLQNLKRNKNLIYGKISNLISIILILFCIYTIFAGLAYTAFDEKDIEMKKWGISLIYCKYIYNKNRKKSNLKN
jgi:uncharacterized membrane protein